MMYTRAFEAAVRLARERMPREERLNIIKALDTRERVFLGEVFRNTEVVTTYWPSIRRDKQMMPQELEFLTAEAKRLTTWYLSEHRSKSD